jgi:hypothetical protein
METRFISPEERIDDAQEVNILVGAVANILDIKIGNNATGVITGFGQGFGTLGAFAATITWSVLLNDGAFDGWSNFFLQRGSLTEPVNPQLFIPPNGRVRVQVFNGSAGAIDAQAMLRINIHARPGVRAGDSFPQGGGGGGNGGGSSPPTGRPPIGGGGGRGGGGEYEGNGYVSPKDGGISTE